MSAALLAGGQSLLAALNTRLAAPSVLIDINDLTELTEISLRNNAVIQFIGIQRGVKRMSLHGSGRGVRGVKTTKSYSGTAVVK